MLVLEKFKTKKNGRRLRVATACFAVYMVLQLLPMLAEIFINPKADFHTPYLVFGLPVVYLVCWPLFSKYLR